MKEAVTNIDEWVLVDVWVPHAVVVIVEWDIVVVGGVVRHGLSRTGLGFGRNRGQNQGRSLCTESPLRSPMSA